MQRVAAAPFSGFVHFAAEWTPPAEVKKFVKKFLLREEVTTESPTQNIHKCIQYLDS